MLKWVGVAAAALVAAFATGTANAQMYLSVGAGFSDVDNATTRTENGVAPGTDQVFNIKGGEGYALEGALGWDLGSVRVEGELSLRRHDNDQYESVVPGSIRRPLDGSIDVLAGMLNAYYDFNSGAGVTPYIGGGVGIAQATIEAIGPRPTAPNGPSVVMIDDQEVDAAWQLMAGVAIPIASNITITGQYRYFEAGTVEVLDTNRRATHVDVKGDGWEAGVRWAF
jgi:opacity protein-like surface antigen